MKNILIGLVFLLYSGPATSKQLAKEMNCSLMCAGRQCANNLDTLNECALNCPTEYKQCWNQGLQRLRSETNMSLQKQYALQQLLEHLSLSNPDLNIIEELKESYSLIQN